MKCYDVRRKLSAFLDGAEEASLRDAVARHVDGCARCRADLESLAGTDRVLRAGLAAAAEAAPPQGYFDDFWPRLSARLDDEHREVDAMSMSTSGSPEDRSSGDRAQAAGNGDPKPERNEVSGLHDIRQLAASTIERHHKEHPEEVGEVADALLTSASPAALGQVLLPSPGREVAPASAAAGGRSAVDPVVVAAAARAPSGWGRTLVIAGAVLVAGGIVAFVMMQNKKQQVVAGGPSGDEARVERGVGLAPEERSAAAEGPAVARIETPPVEAAVPPSPAETTPVEAKPDTKPTSTPAASRDVRKPVEAPKPAVATKPESKPEAPPAAESPPGGAPAEPPKKDPTIEDLFSKNEPEEKPVDKPVETKPSMPTSLTDAEVKKGMRTILGRVGDCYNKYKISGTVTVQTTIDPDGSVTKAIAIDGKFANTETGYCVAEAVGLARFSPWSGTSRTVKYPFALK